MFAISWSILYIYRLTSCYHISVNSLVSIVYLSFDWSVLYICHLIGWQGVYPVDQWAPPTAVVGRSQNLPQCGGHNQQEIVQYCHGGTPRGTSIPLTPPEIPTPRQTPVTPRQPPSVSPRWSATHAPRTQLSRGRWRSACFWFFCFNKYLTCFVL